MRKGTRIDRKTVFKMVLGGYSYRDIGKVYGVTFQRVYDLVNDFAKKTGKERILKIFTRSQTYSRELCHKFPHALNRIMLTMGRSPTVQDLSMGNYSYEEKMRPHKFHVLRVRGAVSRRPSFYSEYLLSYMWHTKKMTVEAIADFFGVEPKFIHTKIQRLRKGKNCYFRPPFKTRGVRETIVPVQVKMPEQLLDLYRRLGETEGITTEEAMVMALIEYNHLFEKAWVGGQSPTRSKDKGGPNGTED